MAHFIAKTSATGPLPAKRKTVNYLLIPFLLLTSLAVRAAPLLEIDGTQQSLNQGLMVDILEDPERNLQIQDVSRAPAGNRFRPVNRGDLNLDFGRADYWLRFSLHNASREQQTPTLKILPPYIQQAELFYGENFRAHEPLRALGLLSPPLLFDLPLPAENSRTFFLHLSDQRQLPVALELFHWPQLLTDYRDTLFFNGITTGALLTLFLYNLIVGLSIHQRANLWLSCYCALVLMAMVAGWQLFDTSQPEEPLRSPLFNTLILLTLTVTIQFALSFGIAPKDRAPMAYTLLRGLSALTFLSAPLALLLEPASSRYLVALWLPMAAIGLVVQPLLSFMAHHDRLVLYYLFSRLWVIIFDSFAFIAFGNEWGNVETINAVLIASTSMEAMLLTGLLVVRNRQKLEQNARERQYLTAAEAENRTRAELLNNLAKRLRSPMSVLMGNIDMLSHSHLSSKQRDYIDTAQKACENLLHEFDVTAAETMRNQGIAQLAPAAVDVRQLAEDCRKDFEFIASQLDCQLHLQVGPTVPDSILSFPARLKQLLHQLINCGFDYSEGQGIDINVESENGLDQPGLRIELMYQGKSLSEQELRILNNRDSHPEAAARDHLRLALTRQLATTLGARLNACNQPEGGARIAISLPYQLVDEGADKPRLPESLSGKCLLVIDSDPDFCHMLQEHAKRWGMQCLIAHDETQAMAIVRNQLLLHRPIESIVVDHQLNTGSANQLLRRIQDEMAANGLPPPVSVLLTNEVATSPAHPGFFEVLAKHNCAYLLRGVLERAYSPEPTV